MEHWMHARHFGRQIQLVSHRTNPVQDGEWTHIFGEEFARPRTCDPEVFSGQQNSPANFKFGLITALIGIELLTLLSGLDMRFRFGQQGCHSLSKVLSAWYLRVRAAALHNGSWNTRMPAIVQVKRAMTRRY